MVGVKYALMKHTTILKVCMVSIECAKNTTMRGGKMKDNIRLDVNRKLVEKARQKCIKDNSFKGFISGSNAVNYVLKQALEK